MKSGTTTAEISEENFQNAIVISNNAGSELLDNEMNTRRSNSNIQNEICAE